jgi:ElaB/YqjD/DUF883 family membrane-anchored ribosome-binding protein
MTSQSVVSVKQLSRESEIARTALIQAAGELNDKVAETIDELKTTLSISRVKEEFKSYAREESSQVLASIEGKARDNPLQAVAIGAAIIYPFWGVLKLVPGPILLIGGGWWLSRQKNGAISQIVAESASDIAHTANQAKASVVAALDAATNAFSETAEGVLNAATSKAGALATTIKDASADTVDAVSETTSDLVATGGRVASQSRTAFDDLIDRNPLLVGGFALAIGAFIAASLPGSRVENELFGERSDEVKVKARAAVSQSVERAKDVATDIAQDIAVAAAQEGLTKEGLSNTIDGVAGAVKAVVDRGLNSALGENTKTSSPSDGSQLPTSANGDLK